MTSSDFGVIGNEGLLGLLVIMLGPLPNETQILMGKINRGEGSLGMMANDKQLYNNLSSSLTSLDKLLDDLKKHPSRYINIRLFGRAPKDNP